MSGVRVSGAWRTPAITSVKVAGTWRTAATVSVKVNGVWRISTFAGAPPAPVMDHHTSTGRFIITNYSPTLSYSATNISGGGSATLDAGSGVYTVSSANSRWSITAAYAIGANLSNPDFMERLAYTYSSVNYPYACGSYQCNCTSGWGSCGCGTCAGYPSPNGQSWGQCGCPGDMCWYNPNTQCGTCTSYCDNWVSVKNGTPSGYSDSYGEWWKVS